MRTTLCLAVLTLSGCAFVPPTPFLQWTPPAPGAYMEGAVAVTLVVNKREPKKGGQAPDQVGNVRSGWGIPWAIETTNANYGVPIPLTEALRRYVTDTLVMGGIRPAMPGQPPTAEVVVELNQFWCDGYVGYKAEATMELVVLDPQTRVPRLRIPLTHADGAGNCKQAFTNVLAMLQNQAINALRDPRVRPALVGAPPPPPPPAMPAAAPTASAPAGCMKDTDCKGERVCVRGACVDAE